MAAQYLTASNEALGILALLFAIVLSGFLLEGWRIVATNDPWAAWSPLGQLAASLSSKVMSVSTMQQAHAVLWWGHLALSFVFYCLVSLHQDAACHRRSPEHLHRQPGSAGASLKTVDFESGTSLGVNSLGAFTWKDLLDLDACTECGRCTLVCPANTVGKELSPSELILELRSLMHSTRATPGKADGQDTPAPLIGAKEAISPERLWQCTTCGACVEACPVFNRADAEDRGFAPVSCDGGSRLPGFHAGGGHVAGGARASIPRHPGNATHLDGRSGNPFYKRPGEFRGSFLGRLQLCLNRSQSKNRPRHCQLAQSRGGTICHFGARRKVLR